MAITHPSVTTLARLTVTAVVVSALVPLFARQPAAHATSALPAVPVVGAARFPVPTDAYVVSPDGDDHSSGRCGTPWRTLAHAVVAAPAHATVVLRAGVYHEDVDLPYRKALTIQNWPGEAVWLDGTRVATGWTADGDHWRLDGWTPRYDTSDPTHLIAAVNPVAAYPAELYLDGVPQTEVLAADQVGPGRFYVDQDASRVLLGSNPTGHEVRITDLREALYVNGGAGSVIRGLGFRRYATPVARMGMVKGYADDVTVSDCVFAEDSLAGLSLNGARAVVRDSAFLDNGQLGLQTNHTDDLLVEDVVVRHNNVSDFATNQAAGGIKVTQSRRVTFRHGLYEQNIGHGLWLDESVLGAVVTGNVFRDNTRHGMDFEISSGLLFVDNLAAHNGEAGIRILEANRARIWQNTFVGNARGIDMLDGDRMAANRSTRGHDSRYPAGDPLMTWEVTDVEIRGNLVDANAPGGRWDLGYDDARHHFGAPGRRITADYDEYWRSSTTNPQHLVAWGSYPAGMRTADSLAGIRTTLGLDTHGTCVAGSNDPSVYGPWALGAPLPADVAALLGVSPGQRIRIGATTHVTGALPDTTTTSPTATISSTAPVSTTVAVSTTAPVSTSDPAPSTVTTATDTGTTTTDPVGTFTTTTGSGPLSAARPADAEPGDGGPSTTGPALTTATDPATTTTSAPDTTGPVLTTVPVGVTTPAGTTGTTGATTTTGTAGGDTWCDVSPGVTPTATPTVHPKPHAGPPLAQVVLALLARLNTKASHPGGWRHR